jgi:protein phosphatase 1 regulatory subunit 42
MSYSPHDHSLALIALIAPMLMQVLYLYDNQIEDIIGLHTVPKLTHLYLQSNLIARVPNLPVLKNLQKLYLTGNCIHMVSGLDSCFELQELHLDNQRLLPGHELSFDPLCLEAVSRTLRVLSVSQCCLTDISPFSCLSNLRRLDASKNAINSLESLEEPLLNMQMLQVCHCCAACYYFPFQ